MSQNELVHLIHLSIVHGNLACLSCILSIEHEHGQPFFIHEDIVVASLLSINPKAFYILWNHIPNKNILNWRNIFDVAFTHGEEKTTFYILDSLFFFFIHQQKLPDQTTCRKTHNRDTSSQKFRHNATQSKICTNNIKFFFFCFQVEQSHKPKKKNKIK